MPDNQLKGYDLVIELRQLLLSGIIDKTVRSFAGALSASVPIFGSSIVYTTSLGSSPIELSLRPDQFFASTNVNMIGPNSLMLKIPLNLIRVPSPMEPGVSAITHLTTLLAIESRPTGANRTLVLSSPHAPGQGGTVLDAPPIALRRLLIPGEWRALAAIITGAVPGILDGKVLISLPIPVPLRDDLSWSLNDVHVAKFLGPDPSYPYFDSFKFGFLQALDEVLLQEVETAARQAAGMTGPTPLPSLTPNRVAEISTLVQPEDLLGFGLGVNNSVLFPSVCGALRTMLEGIDPHFLSRVIRPDLTLETSTNLSLRPGIDSELFRIEHEIKNNRLLTTMVVRILEANTPLLPIHLNRWDLEHLVFVYINIRVDLGFTVGSTVDPIQRTVSTLIKPDADTKITVDPSVEFTPSFWVAMAFVAIATVAVSIVTAGAGAGATAVGLSVFFGFVSTLMLDLMWDATAALQGMDVNDQIRSQAAPMIQIPPSLSLPLPAAFSNLLGTLRPTLVEMDDLVISGTAQPLSFQSPEHAGTNIALVLGQGVNLDDLTPVGVLATNEMPPGIDVAFTLRNGLPTLWSPEPARLSWLSLSDDSSFQTIGIEEILNVPIRTGQTISAADIPTDPDHGVMFVVRTSEQCWAVCRARRSSDNSGAPRSPLAIAQILLDYRFFSTPQPAAWIVATQRVGARSDSTDVTDRLLQIGSTKARAERTWQFVANSRNMGYIEGVAWSYNGALLGLEGQLPGSTASGVSYRCDGANLEIVADDQSPLVGTVSVELTDALDQHASAEYLVRSSNVVVEYDVLALYLGRVARATTGAPAPQVLGNVGTRKKSLVGSGQTASLPVAASVPRPLPQPVKLDAPLTPTSRDIANLLRPK